MVSMKSWLLMASVSCALMVPCVLVTPVRTALASTVDGGAPVVTPDQVPPPVPTPSPSPTPSPTPSPSPMPTPSPAPTPSPR